MKNFNKKFILWYLMSFLYSFPSFSSNSLAGIDQTIPLQEQNQQSDFLNSKFNQAIYADGEAADIVQLLKAVFPDKTAYYYPSVEAKRKLDQIIDYINTTDSENPKSRRLIQVFIDALFHPEGFVRTNAAVFLSDIHNRQVMEPMLLERLHFYLSVNTSSKHSVDTTPSPSTTYTHEISAQNKISLLTVANTVAELVSLEAAFSLIKFAHTAKKAKDMVVRPFTKKREHSLSLQKSALYTLADMRNPVGQQDFALQEQLFHIAFNTSLDWELRVTAIRALLNINSEYPGFAQRLADTVLTETLPRHHEDYFTRSFWIRATAASALAKIQSSDNDIYRKLRQALNAEEHHPDLYKLIEKAIEVTLQSIQRVHSRGPIHTSESSLALTERTKDLTLLDTRSNSQAFIRVPNNFPQIIATTLQETKRTTDLRISVGYPQQNGSQVFNFTPDFPGDQIKELEDSHRKGLYGPEFIETLTSFLTHPEIYLRSTATSLAKAISINEGALMNFLKDPLTPWKQKESAVKLWNLIEPDNPRLPQIVEQYVSRVRPLYKVKSSRRCPSGFDE